MRLMSYDEQYGPPADVVPSTPLIHRTHRLRRQGWSGLLVISCNVLGTVSFVIGSMLWCFGHALPGTLIFAFACALCGISCVIYAAKFGGAGDLVGMYALTQQACGCVIFTAASLAFLYPDHETGALIGFVCASLLFLTGCILTQMQCQSWTGVVAPLLPTSQTPLLPTSLLNSLGSAFFTFGSIALFYSNALQVFGAWCYTVGSICFMFAAWGDAMLWWNMGVTQSEHPQVTSTPDATDYTTVKFL